MVNFGLVRGVLRGRVTGIMAEKTVLVVDDSSLARMMVRKMFSQQYPSWRVVEARDGAEALQVVSGQPVQLAFIDYNMPGINGIELATQLLQSTPTLAIHLVTANVQQKMQERAEALGIGFIGKPVTPDKIAQILGTIPA